MFSKSNEIENFVHLTTYLRIPPVVLKRINESLARLDRYPNIISHAHFAENTLDLHRPGNAKHRDLMHGHTRDITIVEIYLSVGRLQDATNNVKKCRLSRTIWADDSPETAFRWHVEIDVLKSCQAPEMLAEANCF